MSVARPSFPKTGTGRNSKASHANRHIERDLDPAPPSMMQSMPSSDGHHALDEAAFERFIDLANFRNKGLQVEALVEMLAGPIIDDRPPPSKTARETLRATLEQTDRLLGQFERVETELVRLQAEQVQRLEEVTADVAASEGQLQQQVGAVEEGVRGTQQSFRELHERMTGVVGAATSYGERLQTADRVRERALEAVQVLQYLQAFSNAEPSAVGGGGGSGEGEGQLPELFTDESHLTEAGAMLVKLLQVGNDVVKAEERLEAQMEADGGAGPRNAAPRAPEKGSIEYAVQRLEGYHDALGARVVERFDAAVEAGDMEAMAECTRVMSQLPRGEDILMQRYIATRPMFMNAASVVFNPGAGGTATTRDALYELQGLYDDIEAAVKDELLVMEAVFPNPYRGLAELVQRIFEQRVQMMLDGILLQPNQAKASASDLGVYLSFLVDAYKRTMELCDALQTHLGGACNVVECADSVFASHLGGYLDQEFRWLDLKAAAAAAGGRAVNPPLVHSMLQWNGEAVERCAVLCAEASRCHNVRLLFHASTAQSATSGCLLEQVAGHLVNGLAWAVEGACASARQPYGTTSLAQGQSLKQAASRMATKAAAGTMGRVLEAARDTTGVVEAVQQHYINVVEPHLSGNQREHSVASNGLRAFRRALEDKTLSSLNKGLAALFDLVERTLTVEQRKTDFNTSGSSGIEDCTDACVLVTCLLREVFETSGRALGTRNRRAFDAEVGRRLVKLLGRHMLQYSFSPMGALRWKQDVSEYQALLQAARVGGLEEKLEELQGITSILMVAPDGLLSLVDSGLRMSHSQALRYIRLRTDFKTARVAGGQTLEAVFAYD